MKNTNLVLVLSLSASILQAQPTKVQRVEDSVVGWWYKSVVTKPAPYQYKGRNFSIKQQENMNTLIEWMKKTYTPVAGIGTFKRVIYNDDYSFPPHSYGIDFRVWNVSLEKLWLDEKGLFRPIPEEYTRFYVNANVIMGSTPISFVNSPHQYLFVMQPDGYADGEQTYHKRLNNDADPRINPNAYKFLTWVNVVQTVYLVPGNKLPIRPVNKGEYLEIVDAAIDRDKRYPDRHARMHKAVRDLREKHKSTLKDTAVLSHSQPGILDYEGYSDPFEIAANTKMFKHYYPVYEIEPAVLAKCQSDQPQWLCISFPYYTAEDGNQLHELYKSLSENFNYEYAYNYFFEPEKVKGITYRPANEEKLKARLDAYRSHIYWKNPNTNKNLPENVVFDDDFSSNKEGEKPAGWFFRSRGEHTKVSTIKNLAGKWAELGYGNPIFPNTSLKLPLPKDFAIEFDVATDEFNSRTGGSIELSLNTRPLGEYDNIEGTREGTTVILWLTAGNTADFNNNNYSGQARIDINSFPTKNVDNNGNAVGISATYDLREFNNRKNKISARLTVKKGELNLSIDDKLVISGKEFNTSHYGKCKDCGTPAGSLFRTLAFKNRTTNWGVEGKSDGVDVYISNVKITAL